MPGTERRLQYGAIAFRRQSGRPAEVLLVTSKGRRRWIVPKGNAIPGLSLPEVAAREALEEAGVVGKTGSLVASYGTGRRVPITGIPCIVELYSLKVTEGHDTWPEIGLREVVWADCKRY